MTGPVVSTLDLRVIESVLQMSGGYVLDLTNRTFTEFFREHGVDIDHQRYAVDGGSKAHRLRRFLRTSAPPLTGRVLAGLLEHRLASSAENLRPDDLETYRRLVVRLGGSAPESPATASVAAGTAADAKAEAALLRRVFRPDLFDGLPVDDAMRRALVDRMDEAARCIDVNANLAAVILCGSVLEGMCLGFGTRNPERVNRAFSERFNKPARHLHEWRLSEWIDVLAYLGDLSPNIEKFGHGLRDFRNYVHPAEQLAHHFSPNQHTARIGFQVVVAAAEDLVRAAGAVAKGNVQP
jgi:hypothetical protein